MTSEQYDKLSDEEKRIKVAELCGWTAIRSCIGETPTGEQKHMLIALAPGCSEEAKLEHCYMHNAGIPYGVGGLRKGEWELPDYLYDLNAMHAAEPLLITDDQWEAYQGYLLRDPSNFPSSRFAALIHPTAAQRAKAFVLTMTGGKEE